MTNLHFIIKSLYLPFIIASGLGGIIFLQNSFRQTKRHTFAFLICLGIMLLWRLKMSGLNSSRYVENLFVITAIGSAYFVLNWNELIFKKKHNKTSSGLLLKFLLATIVITLIIVFKFSRYNHFYKNYYNIKENISVNQDKIQDQDAAIITNKDQRLYSCGIPQVTVPPFILKDSSDYCQISNTIKQFQWRYKRLYIVSEWNLKSREFEPEEKKRLQLIGCFYKNNKKKCIFTYLYDSPQLVEGIEEVVAPSYMDDDKNLFINGGFEKWRTRNNSDNENYYNRLVQRGPERGNAIPKDKVFPFAWDIYWSGGFSHGTLASIYLTDDKTISGTNSLILRCNDTISFLCEKRFVADSYVFQCDILPLEKTTFGVQLSLRNDNDELEGFREIKSVTLDKTERLYHYSLTIPKSMFYPYNFFYFYFYIYGSGHLIVDNFSLTKNLNP